jgi:serine/threonine protein kinase
MSAIYSENNQYYFNDYDSVLENGSPVNHFSWINNIKQNWLSDANRIIKAITAIDLAMQYLHAQCVIQRDVKTDNVLLDWESTLRIANLGENISPNNPLNP